MDVVAATRAANRPNPNPAADRRKGSRLLVHWQGLRHGRPCPSLADLCPDDLGVLWRYCFTAACGPGGPIFTYIGPALRGAYGVGEGDGLSSTVRGMIVDPTLRAARTLQPVLVERGTYNPFGDELLYRTVALPLSEDQETARHVLGLVDFIVVKRTLANGMTVETQCAPAARP